MRKQEKIHFTTFSTYNWKNKMLLNFSDFLFFCHITVRRLFRNIHPSSQCSSRSLIHVSVYDMYTCTVPFPLDYGVHVHPAH